MKKKTRQILFLFFAFLFALVAPYLVFRSQGYRFDFERKKFVQTGGIFLKILPRQAEVYLNEKFIKKTDLLFGSVLIENLLPRKYKVRVEKLGYHPWEKFLEVKEKEVTSVKNIILIPKEVKFNLLFERVENFWFLPGLKKILFQEKTENGWSLKWYDLEKNLETHLLQEKELFQEKVDLLNLEFSEEEKEVSLKVKMKDEEKEFILKLTQSPPLLLEKKEENAENILVSKRVKKDLYVLDRQGNFFKNGVKLSETAFSPKEKSEYQLMIFGDHFFLKENEALYHFNWNLKSFQQIAEKVKNFQLSPDLKKLAYFTDHEVWVFFLTEEASFHPKETKERVFIARFSEKIDSLAWIKNDYLIFNTGKKIKVAEIDDRDKINIVELGEFESPKIFFSQATKKIYILSKENLYQSEAILKPF